MAKKIKKKIVWTNTHTKRLKDITAKLIPLDEAARTKWLMAYATAIEQGIKDHTKAMLIADAIAVDTSVVLE